MKVLGHHTKDDGEPWQIFNRAVKGSRVCLRKRALEARWWIEGVGVKAGRTDRRRGNNPRKKPQGSELWLWR